MAKKLSNRIVESMFLKLLPVQMFAIAVQVINGLLNSMIVGNMMSVECLGVFGFISPLSMFHNMLSGGIAVGSQILCGKYVGRGDRKSVNSVYMAVTVLCIVIGAVLTVIYNIFPAWIAEILGATGDSLGLTVDYLRGYSWSMIPMMFSVSMIPFLQLNNAQNVMYIAIGAMTTVNIGFDLLNINVFHMGMVGIGNAAFYGYTAFVLVVVIYYFSGKCGVRLNTRDFSFWMIGEIFRLGLPEMLMLMCISIRQFTFNRIALTMAGNIIMSANAVISNVCLLADIVTRGIEGTTNMEASLLYGERDKNSLREILPTVLRVTVPIRVALYALIFIFAATISRIFGVTGEEDLLFTVNYMRFAMLYTIGNTVFAIINNTYKGMGKTVLSSVVCVTNFLIVPILLMLTLPKPFGINGLYLTVPLEETFTTIGLIIYSAVKRGVFPKRLNEVTYIPESFGIGSRDRFDASIRFMDQISDVSRQAIGFCRKKGMGNVKSNFCGLCVEEMAAAILEHGREFGSHRKGKCEIDLRMIYENEGVSILLRDNYPPFNPLEWANIQNPEDQTRYIGVRMVNKMADTVDYMTAINLNVLMIRLDT